MAQYIIDIGAYPDDGQGSPLRTAFDYTNENFTEIYAAGPVGSIVRIANNTITTTVTNANLVLSPSGIGKIQINNSLLPRVDNVYDLGTPTNRFNTIYVGTGGIDTTGDFIVSGNVTADYFIGNGSLLTGVVATGATALTNGNTDVTTATNGNANITIGGVSNVAVFSTSGVRVAGIVSATGNVTGQYFIGNGSQLTGINASSNAIFNGTSNISIPTANSNIVVSVDGVSNVAVFSSLNTTITGNLLPASNVTYNLGSPTQRWKTGYFSGSTLDLDGATITANATSMVLSNPVGGQFIVGGTGIATTGSISNGNSNVSVAANGNVTFGVAGIANAMVVQSNGVTIAGNLDVQGNVTYINVTNLNVQDPIVGIGRGPNNAPLTTNDNFDRGEQLWYYTDAEHSAFIGWQNSSGKLVAATNASVTNEVVTVNNYGNILLGNVEATGISVSGNVTGNYLNGNGTAITSVSADRGSDTNNWDTITQMGVYTVNRLSWSGTTGTPTDSQVFVGLLEVKNSLDTAITQIFYPGTVQTDVKIQWNRANWDGNWTNWIMIVNDQQIVSGGEF